MEIRRFFVGASDIEDKKLTVVGDEFLHMTKVLRQKVGFQALICANDGIEHLCTIEKIAANFAILNIEKSTVVEKRTKSLTLFAGLLKNNKLDLVIQKSVELGVQKIVPFVSKNTAEASFNVERARKIAHDAGKQCGTAYLSEVCETVSFQELMAATNKFDTAILAYECEKKVRIKDIKFVGNNVALVIGPEGGFSEEEIALATSNGVQIVTLGKRILRAETADIVASALTLDALGELDYD